jgi:hypothetical protein
MRVDMPMLSQELQNGTDILDARSLPARLKEQGSLPLLLALRATPCWPRPDRG